MSKTITVKHDEDTDQPYLDMADLADLFEDVTLVQYYEIEDLGGNIALTFFDKDKNQITPKDIK